VGVINGVVIVHAVDIVEIAEIVDVVVHDVIVCVE
jgi:hypothetical protein